MRGTPAIETFGLGKRYAGAKRFAVKDLNITIMPGEVYGFLGPNGAGKSTTIRMLMNFIKPSDGHAIIHDLNVVTEARQAKVLVGYLPGEIKLYPKMTGNQFLKYMQALHPPARPALVESLAKRFQIDLNQKIGSLSKGNRQKIGIIQAFASEPEVLILDEPTSGLDPLMQEMFFKLIRETKKRGAAVFLSSHNLSEVQKICDRVGFIRAGKLVSQQKMGDGATHVQTYEVTFTGEAPLAELKRLPNVKAKSVDEGKAMVQVKGELRPLLLLLARQKVVSIERRDLNLEDEFLRYYRGGSK